tara:strand:+ start:1204 stop:2010 length:807 start_codon:yes stop_codon:yes gene_type:complete
MNPASQYVEVISNTKLSNQLWWIDFHSESISNNAQPGQFVHMLNSEGDDPLLRRPYSLSSIDPDRESASILYHVVGRGSEWLSNCSPGDKIDTIGPLGSPFTVLSDTRHLLMLGGGIGMGPLIALANQYASEHTKTIILNGARSLHGITPRKFIPKQSNLLTATDDGSLGHQGTVVDLLADNYHWADQIFACGPTPMLRAIDHKINHIDHTPSDKRKSVQFALEARMACGIGICYSCVVATKSGPKRVCYEGPVFPMTNLTWDWQTGI